MLKEKIQITVLIKTKRKRRINMNRFMNGLNATNEFGYTENGAVKRTTTKNALMDMFALGGAYRSRSDEDCILLFKNALEENEIYALKCLFYLRDVRGGKLFA